MLQLENINKLESKLIGEWMCYYVGEEGEYYRILFDSMTTTGIRAELIESVLNPESQSFFQLAGDKININLIII